MTIEEYLADRHGKVWTERDTAHVLNHIWQIDATAQACMRVMAETKQSLTACLEVVKYAPYDEP